MKPVIHFFWIYASICFTSVSFKKMEVPAKKPVPVILDTDIGPDVDDAGCVATLHALANNGEAKILGIMCNTTTEWGAPCLDAFNTYYGRPNTPIGTLKGKGSSGDSPEWNGYAYNKYIATHFPNDLRSGNNAPDAAILYRKLLAGQPDNGVIIISVGALSNLRNLLITKPDRYSKLTGLALVRKKVKLLSLMAGGYPKGKENDPNFSMDLEASIQVIKDWPSLIVFSGVEIGEHIKTASALIETEEENPIRAAYIQWDSHFWRKWEPDKYKEGSIHQHNSYDQTSVVYGVKGAMDLWDVSENGTNMVYADGSNQWVKSPTGHHRFLIQKKAPEEIAGMIDDLMVQKPLKKPSRK
jgi:inosine-uridine nucleoside N-ribohydrolase